MTQKRRPGRGASRAGSKSSNNHNNGEITLKPDANLAVETVLKSMPAREEEIHAKVMRQLHGTPLPTPDYIRVLFHQAGSDDSVKADCERMARELNASVLICNSEGKILAFVWWS
jgi:hypothetical protein